MCVVRCLTVGGDGQRQPRAWRSCRSIDGCGQDPTRTVRSGRAPDRRSCAAWAVRRAGAAAPAGKGEGRRTAPAAAPCRGARLGQHPARAWRASVDTVCATFTSLPVYDHLTTRPDPLPIGRRCGRGVAPGGANVKPNRGAVASYYDVRAARDGRCGLPSAEARPPARASWRKATREIRSYTYELGGRVPRSSYETVPRYAARYASRVPRRRRRRAPRRPPPRNGRADGARARECHMRHHAIIRVAIRTVGNHIEYATPFCISDGVHADPRTQSDRA